LVSTILYRKEFVLRKCAYGACRRLLYVLSTVPAVDLVTPSATSDQPKRVQRSAALWE
jgi:hypothetical protein